MKTKLFTFLTLLLCVCSGAWAQTTYYLQDPDNVDGDSPALTGDFYTAADLSFTVNKAFGGVTYTKGLTFIGQINGAGSNMKNADRLVRYDCKTNDTEITVLVYSTTSSKSFYDWNIQEQAKIGSACTMSSVSANAATNGEIISKTYNIKNSTRTSIYFSVGDTKVSVVQIIAVEKGTAFAEPCTAGYQVNFNRGRFLGKSGNVGYLDKTSEIEGLEINPSQDYYGSNNSNVQLSTNNTHYIKFSVDNPMVLKLTTASTKSYTVSTTKGSTSNSITPTANTAKAIKLASADTYYINPQASGVQITGMSFEAAPKVTYDANGGSGSMDNTYFTVADNEFTAPATGQVFDGWNTQADGGGISYEVDAEIEEDVTLFAQWRTPAATHSVTYKLGAGATGTVPTQADVEEGATFTVAAIPGDLVAPAGKEFSTWNDGTTDYAPSATYTMGTSNVVLTAQYVNIKCTTPTIEVESAFNFENKGYKVTITNTQDGAELKVSTDGSSYTTQTSPYVTYATSTTHYYAKAVKDSYDDSEVVDKNVTNAFDPAKSYVAWVYTKGYGSAGYTFAADPMVVALQSVYNVVEVDGGTSAPNADWKNADLIICSEAMQGNNNLSNGMVTLLDGTTPMIGLKAYNYGGTQTRWGWGTPANPSETVYGFTPKSNIYALLDGVTYEEDGTIKLATGRYNSGSQKNVVQTVNFDGASVPSDNVIMGNIDDADSKAVMHYSATMKYFGLGLSSDCHSYYTPSAIAIVKNAAAMLIAGKVLTEEAKTVSGTITASGWNTFSSSYPLDLSTITATSDVVAYYASNAADSKVTLAETGATVPAGEGLMIKGEAGETFTIDVAGSGTAIDGNLLVGLPAGGTVAANANNYVFGWTDEKEPGFYFVNSTEPTLGLGKAYLHTKTTLGARLNFFFDDETTGITNNNREDITNNREYFNLAGQRVDQPAKGLYIVNGKKVVVK